MFSVITIVKNGINAVKKVIVRRAVQVEAKQESPAINKNTGIKMLEKPQLEKSMSPSEKKKVFVFSVDAKANGSESKLIENSAAKSKRTTPVKMLDLFDILIRILSEFFQVSLDNFIYDIA